MFPEGSPPTLPAPGAHGGTSLARLLIQAAVTRPGLELDTMTGEPRGVQRPYRTSTSPRGSRGRALGLLPSHRAPTVARAQVPPGQLGRVSPGREPWASCFRRGFCHTGNLSICERPADSEHRGLEGGQGHYSCPEGAGGIRKAGAWGRSWLPRREAGRSPGPASCDPEWELLRSRARRGPTRERGRPSWPGYRRPPETRPHCRRRARGPESGGRRRDWKTSSRLHFLK